MRADYTIGERDSLSVSYTIDNGNSMIPQADPLFASAEALRKPGGEHSRRRTCSRRAFLNTFDAPDFRGRRSIWIRCSLASFPASTSFVAGGGPGGDRDRTGA